MLDLMRTMLTSNTTAQFIMSVHFARINLQIYIFHYELSNEAFHDKLYDNSSRWRPMLLCMTAVEEQAIISTVLFRQCREMWCIMWIVSHRTSTNVFGGRIVFFDVILLSTPIICVEMMLFLKPPAWARFLLSKSSEIGTLQVMNSILSSGNVYWEAGGIEHKIMFVFLLKFICAEILRYHKVILHVSYSDFSFRICNSGRMRMNDACRMGRRLRLEHSPIISRCLRSKSFRTCWRYFLIYKQVVYQGKLRTR